jgi:hypothetical protein
MYRSGTVEAVPRLRPFMTAAQILGLARGDKFKSSDGQMPWRIGEHFIFHLE